MLPSLMTSTVVLLLVAPAVAAALDPAPKLPADQLANVLAGLVRDALPTEYEKKKDWERTKRITTGLKVDGKLPSLRIHRRKKEVPHGLWKHYRARIVNTDQTLSVRVENLQSSGPARAGCTLIVEAPIDGWARFRHYNRGLHLGTVTLEGSSQVRIEVDCEVGLAIVAGRRLPALALHPEVKQARVVIEDFNLHRVGEIEGRVAREMGRGLRRLLEDKLTSDRITARLNASIARHKDRLILDPSDLIAGRAKPTPPPAALPGTSHPAKSSR